MLNGTGIEEHFGRLTDKRRAAGKRHKLIDIIVIAICGVISGADDWPAIEEYGLCKEEWLRSFLGLPHGIPSHDTFGRVFRMIDPEEFANSFMRWVKEAVEVTAGQVIAVDGKVLRGSQDETDGKAAIHMVSAWAEANHLVLGQRKIDAKANEIKAIPELLRLLDIHGCVVAIDAMGCQREIAETIVLGGGDYVLALKENQPQLYQDVVDLFAGLSGVDPFPHDTAQDVGKQHGRIETRICTLLSDPAAMAFIQSGKPWAGLRSVVRVQSKRQRNQEVSEHTRYYISSLVVPAARMLQLVRSRWSIENSLHWVLDIAFQEDHNRVHKDHGPENLAVLRHVALNLVKQDQSIKLGVKNKRLKCAWDNDYLLRVLKN
jgi:predicted transposase YbfD/YdcC